MAWVMEHTPESLNGTEQSVAMALANYATNEGGHAYPSIAQLCRITRWSERTVRNALRSLEAHGVIAIERPATNKLPTMYRFVAFRGATDAPQPKTRGASASARGASNDRLGGTCCPLSVSEPSEEPLDTPLSPPAGGSAPKRGTRIPEDWEPSPMDRGRMRVLLFTDAEMDRETEKFIDHFTANGKPMKDWSAAWRNWMRRSREFASRASPNGHESDGSMTALLQVNAYVEHFRAHGVFPDEPLPGLVVDAVKAAGGWEQWQNTGYQRRDFQQAYRELKGART